MGGAPALWLRQRRSASKRFWHTQEGADLCARARDGRWGGGCWMVLERGGGECGFAGDGLGGDGFAGGGWFFLKELEFILKKKKKGQQK